VPQHIEFLNDPITNDEVLSSKPMAPSPSVVGKNLHDHHIKLQECIGNLLLILITTFQL
jgi:hypothetical protein